MSSVDVVVPCYGYGHYLRECVESVLDQTGVNVRVLIIDDASSDDTPDVGQQLARRDPRVTFRRHAVNNGHIATYNEGLLDWASAEYALLLSADDALVPGALARAARVMDCHRQVGMVYGMARVIGVGDLPGHSEAATDAYRIVPGPRFLRFCCETCSNPVPTPTAVVRTEVQRHLGGYRAEFPHTGDLEMWMRFAVHGPVGALRAEQGYYRWHGNNMGLRYYDQMLNDRREFAHVFKHVLSPLAALMPESRQWAAAASQQLAGSAFRYAASAFDRGAVEEYGAWLAFAKEVSASARGVPPWRLQLRRIVGQAFWQKIRPTLNRLRGRPAAWSPRREPSLTLGAQWGWWPGSA